MRLKRFLKAAAAILIFSALMDYLLWFTIRFHVPSWTIATLSLCLAIILLAFSRFLSSLKVLGRLLLEKLPNTIWFKYSFVPLGTLGGKGMSFPDKLTVVYEKVAEFEAHVVKTSGKYAIIVPKPLGEKLWGK